MAEITYVREAEILSDKRENSDEEKKITVENDVNNNSNDNHSFETPLNNKQQAPIQDSLEPHNTKTS